MQGAKGYKEGDKSSKDGFPYLLVQFNYTAARDIDIAMLFIVVWSYALSKNRSKTTIYIKQEFSRKNNMFFALTHSDPEGKINIEAIKMRIDQRPFQEILSIIFDGYASDGSKDGRNLDMNEIKCNVSRNFKNQLPKMSRWMSHGEMVLETIKLVYERFGITETYYEKRKKLKEGDDETKKEIIKDQLKKQWESHKLKDGSRKSLNEIADEANKAFECLRGKKFCFRRMELAEEGHPKILLNCL